MSDDLLKAFNAAADAAHIAALAAYEAVMDLKRSAEKLNNIDKGFSRAAYTGMYCEHPALALLETTGDTGDNVNDTPRSRGVELPKKSERPSKTASEVLAIFGLSDNENLAAWAATPAYKRQYPCKVVYNTRIQDIANLAHSIEAGLSIDAIRWAHAIIWCGYPEHQPQYYDFVRMCIDEVPG